MRSPDKFAITLVGLCLVASGHSLYPTSERNEPKGRACVWMGGSGRFLFQGCTFALRHVQGNGDDGFLVAHTIFPDSCAKAQWSCLSG